MKLLASLVRSRYNSFINNMIMDFSVYLKQTEASRRFKKSLEKAFFQEGKGALARPRSLCRPTCPPLRLE